MSDPPVKREECALSEDHRVQISLRHSLVHAMKCANLGREAGVLPRPSLRKQ
jgi:hypothetical protein